MNWNVLSTVFASVFVAELRDKTQLATMLFASDKDVSKLTVFIGAALALVCHLRDRSRRGLAHLTVRRRETTALCGGNRVYRHRHLDAGKSIATT